MFHILHNHLAPANRPLLRSMFADRKRLFVQLFGWELPVIDGAYEIDRFDTDQAVYVIAAGSYGEHEASISSPARTKVATSIPTRSFNPSRPTW